VLFSLFSLLNGTKAEAQGSLSDTLQLYPATIIALHPEAGEVETLDLDYVDQMAHDGGALLNRITGITTIRKGGGYGFDPVLRGFKYDQINVVYNGAQSATAACPNRMDPPTSQMAPNMIERIEILKGPHALRYGCSFGATINFIPVSPQFSEEGKTYGRVSGGYESNGNIYRSEGLLGLSGAWYDLGMFGSWSQGGDYTSGDNQTIQADFLRGSFGSQLAVRISERQQLKVSATRNMARDADFAALPMDLREDNTWLFNTEHEMLFSSRNLKKIETSLYGSFVDHLMDNHLKPLDPRMVNAETLATTHNYGGRSEGTWSFSQSRLYAGIDFRVEGAEGSRVREFLMGPNQGKIVTDNAWQDGEITRTGIFSEYHVSGLGIHWVLSARMELNQSEISDPDANFSGIYPETTTNQFNPGLSIGGTRQVSERFSTGLWIGRAMRSGSLTERFINYFPVGQDPYEMVGNPMLDPEVNNQADLNLQWRSSGTTLRLDLFTAYMQDFISSVIDNSLTPKIPSSPGVRRYTNIDRAFKTGFEFSWGQKLFAGMQHQFSVAYTYGQDLVREEPLPEIAPLDVRYHLSGAYLDSRLRPHVTFRHVIEQSRISGEFGERVTPSFSVVDLGLSYQVHRLLGVTAGINNLLDTAYYEHLNRSVRGATSLPIYAPGRGLFLSFTVDFR
ncbi:MAG: TonB-dependent receptor, partial [Bacteroidota bacterium]